MRFAAAIEPDLERFIVRLAADRSLSIAEINRRVGARAEATGRFRPGYSAVRIVVNLERPLWREPSWGDVLLDVASRTKTPDIIGDKILHTMDRHLPEDWGIRQPPRRAT